MVAPLRRVLVCSPRAAGWDTPGQSRGWQQLGFRHAPAFAAAQQQHEELCQQLQACGAEVLHLPPSADLSLDAVYTHDPSILSDVGLLVLHPAKANRVEEARHHKTFLHSLGIPITGEIRNPAAAEGGDMVWLDAKTLLVGHGYRTNTAGIFQIRAVLAPAGVQVLAAPLPYGAGPSECLHLMSLMSVLDEKTVLVDLPWLAVETVELLKARGYHFIEIDPAERATLACNVLSLGERRLLALEENAKTNHRLRSAGFDLRTFPGSELCINGGGGPTCLTRPLLRG